MNNDSELGQIGLHKKEVVVYVRYYRDICLEGLRKSKKTSVGIAGLRAEI
jgi:hypothetical protein